MAEPAVARETLVALRETIARIEGKPVPALAAARNGPPMAGVRTSGMSGEKEAPVLALGVPALDERLQGGLPLDALTEIRGDALRNAGAVTGFALAVCALMQARRGPAPREPARFLWIGERLTAMEAGLPHRAGLQDFGLDPESLLYAAPRRIEEALWLAETALASRAFTAVILEVRGNPARFGLTESRRLSLKARAAGRPLYLLRQAGQEEASSALFRLHVKPAPSRTRFLPDGTMLGGSIGNPVFCLTLEKSRLAAFDDFYVEWNAHDRLFSPAAAGRHAARTRKPAHSGSGLSASAHRPDRAQALGTVMAFGRAS